MTQTSWFPTGKPTDAKDVELIKRRACCDPLLAEHHSLVVLDNDHPGVAAAERNDPEGWRITLQHVTDQSSDFAASGLGGAIPRNCAFRGESREFATMRTSMHRWAHPRTVLKPVRPLDTQDLAYWQTGVLAYLASTVNGLDVDEDIFWTTLFHMGFRQELMPEDLESRRLMFRLQHHRGPTIWLDWTWDLRVALYFACHEDPTCNGRVWFSKVKAAGPMERGMIDKLKKSPFCWVAPTHADPSDQRLQVQSSVFLFLENGGVVWRSEHRNKIHGITIPASHKQPVLRELRKHDVSCSSLFPPMCPDLTAAVRRLNRDNLGMFVSSD